MKTLSAKIDGKVVKEWPIPERPEEITYRQKIMFSFAYDEFINRSPDLEGPDLIRAYAKVIASFFDVQVSEVMNLPVNYFDQFEKQMTGLFLYIFALLSTYVPKLRKGEGDHIFSFKGEEWILPYAIKAKDTELTFGQAIELMEIERKANADAKLREDIDNITYSSNLMQLAVMVHKKDEQLPADEVALKKLVNERIHHFADVDMVTMEDCIFFSTRGSRMFPRIKIFNGYGTHQRQQQRVLKMLKRTIAEGMQVN